MPKKLQVRLLNYAADVLLPVREKLCADYTTWLESYYIGVLCNLIFFKCFFRREFEHINMLNRTSAENVLLCFRKDFQS